MKNWRENVEQVFGPLSISWILPIPPNLIYDGTDFPKYENSVETLLNPLSFNID